MNNILIAAYNETFRQSSDPVYAHTPMRNVGELRTFNPKLKDSAGGEVNKKSTLYLLMTQHGWASPHDLQAQCLYDIGTWRFDSLRPRQNGPI